LHKLELQSGLSITKQLPETINLNKNGQVNARIINIDNLPGFFKLERQGDKLMLEIEKTEIKDEGDYMLQLELSCPDPNQPTDGQLAQIFN